MGKFRLDVGWAVVDVLLAGELGQGWGWGWGASWQQQWAKLGSGLGWRSSGQQPWTSWARVRVWGQQCGEPVGIL